MDINVYFDPKCTNELCDIMFGFGSDKGKPDNTGWHNYTTYYHEVFKNVRTKKLRVFEVGLGTNNTSVPSNMGVHGKPGASLRGWKVYFPNSEIFGADIDSGVLFAEDRISTFYCDQTDPKCIHDMWSKPELSEGFDIIIDDGLHTFDANKCLFENSIHKLNVGGVYIIEDILNGRDYDLCKQQVEVWKSTYPNCVFRFLPIPHRNNLDNTLLCIQRLT